MHCPSRSMRRVLPPSPPPLPSLQVSTAPLSRPRPDSMHQQRHCCPDYCCQHYVDCRQPCYMQADVHPNISPSIPHGTPLSPLAGAAAIIAAAGTDPNCLHSRHCCCRRVSPTELGSESKHSRPNPACLLILPDTALAQPRCSIHLALAAAAQSRVPLR